MVGCLPYVDRGSVEFIVPLLPSGVYNVKAALSGNGEVGSTSILVSVGELSDFTGDADSLINAFCDSLVARLDSYYALVQSAQEIPSESETYMYGVLAAELDAVGEFRDTSLALDAPTKDSVVSVIAEGESADLVGAKIPMDGECPRTCNMFWRKTTRKCLIGAGVGGLLGGALAPEAALLGCAGNGLDYVWDWVEECAEDPNCKKDCEFLGGHWEYRQVDENGYICPNCQKRLVCVYPPIPPPQRSQIWARHLDIWFYWQDRTCGRAGYS